MTEMTEDLKRIIALNPRRRKNILEVIATIGAQNIVINNIREEEAKAIMGMIGDTLQELRKITSILTGAMQETKPEPELPFPFNEKQTPQPQEEKEWITGPEAAKRLNWKTCNVRMLLSAGIRFLQAQKYGSLRVYAPDIDIYNHKRELRKKRAK